MIEERDIVAVAADTYEREIGFDKRLAEGTEAVVMV